VIKIHSCKNLHKLPDSITQLSKLQVLDIRHGALSDSLRAPRHPSTWPDVECLDIPAGWRDDLVGWPHVLDITVWHNNQLHPHVYRPDAEYTPARRTYSRRSDDLMVPGMLFRVTFNTEPPTVSGSNSHSSSNSLAMLPLPATELPSRRGRTRYH
jgi:hypothetical protein